VETPQMTVQIDADLKEKIDKKCHDISGSRQISAISLYGPWVCGYADAKTELNVLLIINRFPYRLNTYHEVVKGVTISILTINRSDFERDIEKGWLGDFLAEKVIIPYEPLKNAEYLWFNELKIKKRKILELVENLILEFPESSHEFLIKKEYFMHEVMIRRAKLFLPITYSYLNMTKGTVGRKNVKKMMYGYLKAFNELEKEKVLFGSDGYLKITQKHVDTIRKRKLRTTPFLKSFQRMTMPHLLRVFSESTNSIIQEQRLFLKKHHKVSIDKLISKLEDPNKHILLPTPLGLSSLSDKSNITDIARKILPHGKISKMKIKKIGGVLNEVYSLTLTKNGEEQKFIVKQFLDWSNLKWLPLTIWAFGTTSFSVLGRSRLEKEYAINKFLYDKGFPVPKIFYISLQKRLIFQEFIEGNVLVQLIQALLLNTTETGLAVIKDVGRKIAEAHSLGVCLGDCKPENFIVTKDKIVILDLEQATRNGNQVWDIAEFLYYSGHYVSPISSANAIRIITKTFIEGYIEGGGKKDTVKKAGSARYTKVFSLFTPIHILFAISKICQKRE
jgi:tRNA A-37 threonylcarbamoyl transferase component Bud32